MKKSFSSDDSFNFARNSLNSPIQIGQQHHRTILSQIPTWFLTHSHRAPPAFFCWQCQILSPTVVFIHHPKQLLHVPGILPKVAFSLHWSPGKEGMALPCHLQTMLAPSCSPSCLMPAPHHHSPPHQLSETARKREPQLHSKGGCYREAAQKKPHHIKTFFYFDEDNKLIKL